MIITAYSAIRSADVTYGHVAIPGTSPDYVANGTRIYSDPLFSDFIEESDGESWMYTADSPTHTTVDDFPGLQTYAAVTGNPFTTHALAVYDNVVWYFHDGQFYWNNAPEGAYELTDSEHTTLLRLIDQGKSLGWYANQRPYIYEAWTRPNYTANTGNPDGAIFTASSEYTYSGTVLRRAYQAMDGVYASAGLNEWRPEEAGPAWWKVVFPFKILITKLTHQNTHRTGSEIAGSAGIIGQYFGNSEATIPIGDQFDSGGTSVAFYEVYNSQTPVVADTIYLVKTASTGGDTTRGTAGIGEVILVADKIIYEVGER
jgi:hypothetical protein